MRGNDVNVFYVPFVVVDIFCLLLSLCSERDEWKYFIFPKKGAESIISYRIRRIPFDTVRNAPEGAPQVKQLISEFLCVDLHCVFIANSRCLIPFETQRKGKVAGLQIRYYTGR